MWGMFRTALILAMVTVFAAFADASAYELLGSIHMPGTDIGRVAAAPDGDLYVTNGYYGGVYRLSSNGIVLDTIAVERPVGLAVDASGRLFVGSTSNGSVSVFTPGGTFLYKLGTGDKEFTLPLDIAVSSANGKVYVVDGSMNVVKSFVYDDSSSSLSNTFGSFIYATGIAVDDAAGLVYVTDCNGLKVRVYNLDGIWQRDIKGSGNIWTGGAKLHMPQGLALEGNDVYVVDSFHSAVAVYTKTGSFRYYIGSYGSAEGEFKNPMDAGISPFKKLYVTNGNNERLEVYGLDSYTDFQVSPKVITFSVIEGSGPLSSSASLDSNNTLQWNAIYSEQWVDVSPGSGSVPSGAPVDITVYPAGLVPGTYSSDVRFEDAQSGGTVVLLVNLVVEPDPTALVVTPSSMNFKYQIGAPELPSKTLLISSTGNPIDWSAWASENWAAPDVASGTTPSSILVSLTDDARQLEAGSYSASLTVDGGDVNDSPASVGISLDVIYAGTLTVTSNIDESSFTATGPKTYTGTGKYWSYDETVPGSYDMVFGYVPGYLRPHARTVDVQSGHETSVDALYRTRPVSTHLAAGTGYGKSQNVRIVPLDGGQPSMNANLPLSALTAEGVRVVSADIDGDGMDEVVAAVGNYGISAFAADGRKIGSFGFNASYAIESLAAADLDGDGDDEVLVGMLATLTAKVPSKTIVVALKFDDQAFSNAGTILEEDSSDQFEIALGDVDADGTPELLTATSKKLDAYDVSIGGNASELWEAELSGLAFAPCVASGDLDGDGRYEVILSDVQTVTITGRKGMTTSQSTGLVKVYGGDGAYTGVSFTPFSDVNTVGSATVSSGDIDGDGADEIVVGTPIYKTNPSVIRVFEGDGAYTGITLYPFGAFETGGVNAAPGRYE